MEITDKGLPIHKDATLKIRPRIFLEGNFFVDLSPGTPSVADARRRRHDPRRRRPSSPVQLDEVLTALQSDTREDLKTLLDEYGTRARRADPTASDKPPAQDDDGRAARPRPSRSTTPTTTPARRCSGAAIVNEAFLGEEPHDLSRLIAGLQKVTAALGRNEARPAGLRRELQPDAVDLRRREGERQRDDPRSCRRRCATPTARSPSLNRAFPPTRAFAREILPGVRETRGDDRRRRSRGSSQTRQLLAPSELQGLAKDLQPGGARPRRRDRRRRSRFFPQQNLLAHCLDRVILPAGDIKIRETGNRAQFNTGVENYKEFWYTMAALAGEGQNFDGNGQYVRFQPGGGTQTLSTGRSNAPARPQFFNPASPPLGTRPVYPGKRPPYRPDVACYKQKLPDLNSAHDRPARRPGPADRHAARRRRRPGPEPAAAAAARPAAAARRRRPVTGAIPPVARGGASRRSPASS